MRLEPQCIVQYWSFIKIRTWSVSIILHYFTLDSMKRFENQGAGDPSDQDVETMIPQSSEREPQSILRRRKPGIVL